MLQSITEKYRPQKLEDLVFVSSTFENKMKEWCSKKELDTHLLLYGAPGLGKSSSINVLIHELNIEDVLIINGSDKTGIDDTRKVIDYASIPPMNSKFKIVVFEEFEKLSTQAQDSLKYVLDNYDNWCKFIFTTNNISKVSEPILTRCQQYNFNTLDLSGFIKRIIEILSKENISFTQDIISDYINKFYPSLRSCLNAIAQNVENNKLNPLNNDSLIITDKFDYILKNFQSTDLLTIKKVLAEKIPFEEYESLYQYFYNHLEDITTNKDNQSNVIRIIAEYLYRNNFVAFPDINFAACIVDLKHLLNNENIPF